jgi:thymidylate synthase
MNIMSADLFLGIPYNIASYALLTHLVAHECGLEVGELVVSIADAHIYKNHLEQVKTQLLRQPLQSPNIELNPEIESVFDFRPKDIELVGYDAHPAIKADVAV